MDIQRTILWVVFSMSLLFLWDSWQRHNGQTSMFFGAPATQQSAAPAVPEGARPSDVPQAMASAPEAAGVVPEASVPGVAAETMPSERITVRTDLMDVAIDTLGAQVVRLELLKYLDAADGKKNFVLFDQSPTRVYQAQTGLIGAANGNGYPTHRTPFVVVPGQRELAPGQDALEVRFEAEAGGVRLIKTYTFTRGSYVIGVRHEIINTSDAPRTVQLYQQLLRDGGKPAGESFFYSTFTGPAVYTEAGKFQKVKFEDIEKGVGKDKHATQAPDGWIAMVQHYFVSAWLPAQGVQREIYTEKVDANLYRVGFKEALGTVEPGATLKNETRLFAGPQEERMLERTAPGLDLVRDYGWLTILSKPLFWLLEKLHGMLGNWGWAIVALTVLIKLVFYPLSAASYKSMAKMKQVAPRMKAIQERHKEDRMKMNQAMMELYKVEKINPMGGCLPILVQIPVFIALYWTLLASVEMRNAPWIGWIHDLAAPDPWFILPVVMMVSMFVQYKLNPTPPDPVQAKIMLFMPLIFGVMFFFFPAGLVLYWVVNNLLSILQQWRITKVIEAGGNGSGNGGGKAKS